MIIQFDFKTFDTGEEPRSMSGEGLDRKIKVDSIEGQCADDGMPLFSLPPTTTTTTASRDVEAEA